MRRISLLPVAMLLVGCPAPPTGLARAQQTAQEFNMDARFGRTELAMDHVAKDLREEFASHHRDWGTSVRVADVELTGLRAHGDHDMEALVRVGWFRPEEEELHVTTLKQKWHEKDAWQLVSEQRQDGDMGLLGEPVVFQAPQTPRPHAQFPTVRLGGDEEQ